MKSRNERLSEHLLQTDDAILNTAYEIDDPEKLKAYKKTQSAPITLLPRRAVWVPVVAAAACVALTVGLWQGGVFGSEKLPVEAPNEGTTTGVTDPTDTDVVTEPTDKPDADATTDGTADTTTDTQHPDKTDTTETTKPTATDKTDPTKTEKPATSVTGGTDKTEPTKNTTTGKEKPTTKPTTKTEPPKTTGTTEKKWPVIVADAPDVPVDNYPSSVCPLLKLKMEQYKGVDVKYSVIVEVCYPNLDDNQFWQSNEELAQFKEEYDKVVSAFDNEAKRLNPSYTGNPKDIEVWTDELRENYELALKLTDEMWALRDKYGDSYVVAEWEQRMKLVKEIGGEDLVPISTDKRFIAHVARNTDEAFFMELTAEEIKALEKDGNYIMRLKYPGGDWGAIDL